jgi:hypothetical protein
MEDSGLESGYRGYSDPIYQSRMMGKFVRSLVHSNNNRLIKFLVAIYFLLIPIGFSMNLYLSKETLTLEKSMIGIIGGIFLLLPMGYVGVLLLKQAITNKGR